MKRKKPKKKKPNWLKLYLAVLDTVNTVILVLTFLKK